jgi:hypothetical protein
MSDPSIPIPQAILKSYLDTIPEEQWADLPAWLLFASR